jgi:protein-L-isoaspartate(D-aspartate) O-methyltransferase
MNPEDIRRFYAEEIRVVANLRSPELVKAFAKVPRENFLGDGPWSYATPDLITGEINYRETVSDDPVHLYHNVPIAIDSERGLPNGQPSAIGSFIDNLDLKNGASVLHIGCGTGYFSAVMAEIVGDGGKVTAVEIETDLAARAGRNLSYLPQVNVVCGDGSSYDSGPVDAILVNAGATAPVAIWLDNLKPGGRFIVPLTVSQAPGSMGSGLVLSVKREKNGYKARFISPVAIYHCFGGRDDEANSRLLTLMMQGKWRAVQSLRRDGHEITDSCCLHGESICLSALAVAESAENAKRD